MSRFVDQTDLIQHDLGDEEWIKVLSRISYSDAENIIELGEKSAHKRGVQMITSFVKEWNLKNKDGEVVPITEEWVSKLDLETFQTIIKLLTPLIQVEEKKSVPAKEDNRGESEGTR